MKDDLGQRLHEAREHLHLEWDDRDLNLALLRFQRARRRRKALRLSLLATTGIAIAIMGAFFFLERDARRRSSPMPSASDVTIARPTSEDRLFHLGDGSTFELLRQDSKVVVAEISPHRVRVIMSRGGASFHVTRRPRRWFYVRAGDVTVTVVGTMFTVDRAGARTRVEVREGQVKVSWQDGEKFLLAGEEGVFPPEEMIAKNKNAPRQQDERLRRRRPSWRALAKQGQYARAYDILERTEKKEASRLVQDEPRDLFLAADSARLSGHPAQAIPYLRRIVRDHDRDPRASLAAFTLGRVLLAQLNKPRQAARAFSKARVLTSQGALAEDALAREVEAWAKAGELQRAQELAKAYLRRYPGGRLAKIVRMHASPDP